MSLENLKKLIGEDIFNQYIAPKIEGKDYFFAEGKDFIPKSRFDEVNETNKELKNQIASRDSQLVELQKSAKEMKTSQNKLLNYNRQMQKQKKNTMLRFFNCKKLHLRINTR